MRCGVRYFLHHLSTFVPVALFAFGVASLPVLPADDTPANDVGPGSSNEDQVLPYALSAETVNVGEVFERQIFLDKNIYSGKLKFSKKGYVVHIPEDPDKDPGSQLSEDERLLMHIGPLSVEKDPEGRRLSQKIQIYRSGEILLPAPIIDHKDRRLKFFSKTILVKTSLNESGSAMEQFDNSFFSFNYTRLFLAALLLAALAYIAHRILKYIILHRKRRPRLEQQVVDAGVTGKNAWQLFQQELAAVQTGQLNVDPTELEKKLEAAFRNLLRRVYRFKAEVLTTRTFLDELNFHGVELDAEERRTLHSLLLAWEKIKFAGIGSDRQSLITRLQTVHKLGYELYRRKTG